MFGRNRRTHSVSGPEKVASRPRNRAYPHVSESATSIPGNAQRTQGSRALKPGSIQRMMHFGPTPWNGQSCERTHAKWRNDAMFGKCCEFRLRL